MTEAPAAVRCDVELSHDEWARALTYLPDPCHDVYFTPAYHELHGADGSPLCSMVEEAGMRLLIPGLAVPIEAAQPPAWDLQTCNGYGGPLASPAATGAFLRSAWDAWRRASAEKGLVAAFFRLHPLVSNARWLPEDAAVRVERKTVFVDLTAGVEAVWKQARSSYRNKVQKGRRERLEVVWDSDRDWTDFTCLYADAMERLAAPPCLRYGPAYMQQLRAIPGARLAAIRVGGRLAAASVFLFGAAWAHYHLSARSAGTGNHLMNFLLQAAVERACDLSLLGMHLGGGRTAAPDDPLLQFKASLGGCLLDFSVALVICDRPAYRRLMGQWQATSGAAPAWLLGYRQPMPGSLS